jgi:hypothetical protein
VTGARVRFLPSAAAFSWDAGQGKLQRFERVGNAPTVSARARDCANDVNDQVGSRSLARDARACPNFAKAPSSRCPRVFLSFSRIAAVEVPPGADPAVQIFNDDIFAFTSLIDLMLLSSAALPHLCDCRLAGAEAYHAEGNGYTDNCNTAQSLLPRFAGQV